MYVCIKMLLDTTERRNRAKQQLQQISSIIKLHNCCITATNEEPPSNHQIINLFETNGISKDDLTNFIWWLNTHDLDVQDKFLNTAAYDEICEHLTTIVELKTGITFYVGITDTDAVVSVYPTKVE